VSTPEIMNCQCQLLQEDLKVKLMMIQEEELSSERAAYFSAIYKSSDDSDCSNDEAEIRQTEKMADPKEAKTFTSNGEWGWPSFQHCQEGVSIFWRLLQGG
jgi:hypothetical protein